MSETLILGLFASVFLGIIGYAIIYQLLKYMKGTIEIILPKREFYYGESISGDIQVKAKKDISVLLCEIHLIAYKKERVYTNKWTRTKHLEILRQSEIIEKKDLILSGTTRSYDYSLRIPEIFELPEEMQRIIKSQNTRTQRVQTYHRGFSWSFPIRWNIKVILQAEWLDLHRQEFIVISVPIHWENI